jgi:hypothetical protein
VAELPCSGSSESLTDRSGRKDIKLFTAGVHERLIFTLFERGTIERLNIDEDALNRLL